MFAAGAAFTVICRVFSWCPYAKRNNMDSGHDKLQKESVLSATGRNSNSSQQRKLCFLRLHPQGQCAVRGHWHWLRPRCFVGSWAGQALSRSMASNTSPDLLKWALFPFLHFAWFELTMHANHFLSLFMKALNLYRKLVMSLFFENKNQVNTSAHVSV